MIVELTGIEQHVVEVVAGAARKLGYPAYVVGGFVRDRLLGRETKDIDVVCVGEGIRLAEEVASALTPKPKVSVFSRFGTAMLQYRDLEVEFVGARKESYAEHSRKPDVEAGTLEDDQNRRDFTINALAISLNASDYGAILDPFGGLRHLEEKRIRTPLDPGTTFSDDPLRMMRAIRFANQLGFSIDPETFRGIQEHRERIRIISMERIRTELEKILMTSKPSVGFGLLFDSGLLQLILPEVAALQGVEDRYGRAHKDNFYHTLEVLDNLCSRSDNIYLRWSALLHDIAKPIVKRYSRANGWTFHGHEWVGAQSTVPRIFRHLKLPLGAELAYVRKMVRLHQRPISLTKEEVTDSAVRRLIFDAGEDVEDLFKLCESDITTKNPGRMRRYLEGYELLKSRIEAVSEADRLRLWQPPVTGELIMETFGLKPSPAVGQIKTAVREAILDGVVGHDFESACRRMLEEGKKMGLEIVKYPHQGE